MERGLCQETSSPQPAHPAVGRSIQCIHSGVHGASPMKGRTSLTDIGAPDLQAEYHEHKKA